MSSPLPHVAFFPFMSKGHIIPLIHLAHLLHRRCLATFTFFTTPLNAPFIRDSLAGTDASIVELPFPENAPGLPPGIESTDRLPDMSLFLTFYNATKQLRPHFEQALASLPTAVSFLISDGFLGWSTESAAKLGIPRVASYGMGCHAMAIQYYIRREKPHRGLASDDQPFTVSGFPNLRLTLDDLTQFSYDPHPADEVYKFVEEIQPPPDTRAVVDNSFYELEPGYVDHWNSHIGPKAWCIGLLCLAQQKTRSNNRTELLQWLDSRVAMNRPVVYVAFGSQAEISELQLKEIAIGLERSGVDFLWVVRAKGVELGEGFEERVAERGKVVREWVDQLEILQHESIRAFVSHCGWNSVTEGISAGVPILAWPMMAEQRLNARFLVQDLGIGLRVRASDGTREGLVRGEDIAKLVRELVDGEKGKEAAKKAKDLARAARMAMEEGGSSWRALEQMIAEVSQKTTTGLAPGLA
ncbi:UDP-glycosyltransferase 90A1-like [Phoenix dactylifera]|uniref:Glycosyltransferase n=1 Tax=Phoenix dactylifera TaxID=42345 RepID=A0A8B8J1S1_PHODC|nr:UDP-glycosyltransferase 90A1-like [Phoenix dactylifera]